jgi:hypothetical protein
VAEFVRIRMTCELRKCFTALLDATNLRELGTRTC